MRILKRIENVLVFIIIATLCAWMYFIINVRLNIGWYKPFTYDQNAIAVILLAALACEFVIFCLFLSIMCDYYKYKK